MPVPRLIMIQVFLFPSDFYRFVPASIIGRKTEERPRKSLLPRHARAMTGYTRNTQDISMPIRKHLTDKTAFGPVAIEAMSKAF